MNQPQCFKNTNGPASVPVEGRVRAVLPGGAGGRYPTAVIIITPSLKAEQVEP